MERRVLGGVKYLHDLTVTHTDVDYMRKVPSFPPSSVIFCNDLNQTALRDRIQTRAHRLERNPG
jgi:hypothetical protein